MQPTFSPLAGISSSRSPQRSPQNIFQKQSLRFSVVVFSCMGVHSMMFPGLVPVGSAPPHL